MSADAECKQPADLGTGQAAVFVPAVDGSLYGLQAPLAPSLRFVEHALAFQRGSYM